MIINLMTNHSPNNKVGKDISDIKSASGSVRGTTSIIDPVIEISASGIGNISKLNYCYIPDFGRYYFINNITAVRTGVWRIECHVDVLQTYASGIRAQYCVIARQEGKYNLFLDDGTLKAYNNPKITTHKFPNTFNTQSFVMAVAGG